MQPIHTNSPRYRLPLCRVIAFFAVLALVSLSPVAFAQTFTWDADQTPPATGSTGATTAGWDSGTRWFNGTADVAWDNTGTIDAVFPQTAGTVTIGSGTIINLHSINFTNTAGNYILGGASLTSATPANTNGSLNFGGVGTIVGPSTASQLNQGINSNISASTTDLFMLNNNPSATANRTLMTLGGNNYFTGSLILSGATQATQYGASDSVGIVTPLALPGTASILFARNYSQINFSTNGNNGGGALVATFNNNIVLNSNNITPVTPPFRAGIGASVFGSKVQLGGVISGNADLDFTVGLSGGNGVLQFNNNNTYTGNTYLLMINQSVIRLGVDNALPTTTGFTFGPNTVQTLTAGALDLNGHNQTIAFLNDNLNHAAGSGTSGFISGVVNNTGTLSTLNIKNLAATATSYGGPIGSAGTINNMDGTRSNNIRLKLDALNIGTTTLFNGTIVLNGVVSGTNPAPDYVGGTQIDGGTMYLNNITGSGTGTGSITVGGAGSVARIGGNGTVTGDLHLFNQGEISPGSTGSNVGIFHTGNEEWSVGGSYRLDVADATGPAGTGYDQAKLDTGAVNLTSNSGSKFTISINGTPTNLGSTHDWIVADGVSAVQLNGTPVDAGAAAAFNAGGWMSYFVVDNANFANNAGVQSVQISGDLTDIVVHYEVPEPSSAMLLVIGVGGLLTRRAKRRRLRPLAA